jgi:hypothetical protein
MTPLTVPRRAFIAVAILFRILRLASPRMHGDERDYCDGAARFRGGQRWTRDDEIAALLEESDRGI